MIRAAAKNSASVAVVVVAVAVRRGARRAARATVTISQATRDRLAARAFAHTAAYDTAVAAYLAERARRARRRATRIHHRRPRSSPQLRYGENPHQTGALYAIPGAPGGVAHARQLQGSALSFTNWLDVDAARRLVCDFDEPAAAIIKHTNPCGFAVGSDAADAYRRAFECDPRSAFGGIVAVNRPLDEATAEELAKTFLEAVVVPADHARGGSTAGHEGTPARPRRRAALVCRAARRAQHRRRPARADSRPGQHRPCRP